MPKVRDSSPEEDGGGHQEDGRAEEVGAAVVAGCKTPPVFQSGKERLDFVTPAIQPLVVMDWLLTAATGRDARRDALLGQHLVDFVPVISLIPNHRSSRWLLEHPTSASEVTALPSRRWSRRGPPLLWQTPWSLLVMPPLLRLDAVGWALMSVASIISTSGSGASGGSAESDADNSEKIRSKTPLSHQRRQRL